MERWTLLVVFYAFSMIPIVIGNGLVIICVSTKSSMKTATNIFICSLSVADFIVGMFVIPTSIAQSLPNSKEGFIQCEVVPALQLLSISASIMSLLCLAADRYRAIVQPNKQSLTKKDALKMVGLVWLLACVYSLRHGIQSFLNSQADEGGDDEDDLYVEEDGRTVDYITSIPEESEHEEKFCNIFMDEAIFDIYFRYIDFIILFLIPMIVLVVVYTVIVRTLNKKAPTGTSNLTTVKKWVVKMCIVIVVLFFLSWGPYHLVELTHDTIEIRDGEEGMETTGFYVLRVCTIFMALSNSWTSVVVYTVFNKQFRKEVMMMLRCGTPNSVEPSSYVPQASTSVIVVEQGQ